MMRTSRKKLLRLDEKTCYGDDLDYSEEDDDFDLVLSLPVLPPRMSREVKAQQLEEQQEQWGWDVEEAS